MMRRRRRRKRSFHRGEEDDPCKDRFNFFQVYLNTVLTWLFALKELLVARTASSVYTGPREITC